MTKTGVFLHGVALANYRGIGPKPQLIAPFGRFNFFIGPNNAGKSCVLNFISRHLKPLVCTKRSQYDQGVGPTLDPLDVHLGATQAQVRMGIAVQKSDVLAKFDAENNGITRNRNLLKLINAVFDKLCVEDSLWLERKSIDRELTPFQVDLDAPSFAGLGPSRDWENLWQTLTRRSGGDLQHHWIPESLKRILGAADSNIPKVSLVPAIREISQKGEAFDDWTGKGLIEELARLQNPGVHERQRLTKFQQINAFLQAVTENASASIEIPHDREHVLVHMDDKVLPLESLGTGIHEVVMLAAFCTLMEEQIVCIEEPEIHLHPVLQRRLIRYLQEQTSNQYFIATHSASLIDTPDGAVFHVTSKNGNTTIQAALTPTTRFEICSDLGYKASDLLQTNAVIWVEGPSDRIYIRHWIKAIDPELQEGIDYSIMFYGGRLLSHLSADDAEVSEEDVNALIALRKLNRNLSILMDSDKECGDDSINATKLRILDELEGNGLAWITAGREIENYVPKDLMTEALQSVYERFDKRIKTGHFDHVLPFKRIDGKVIKEVDKVAVAKAVCAQPACLDMLDLRDRVTELVRLIHQANA